MAELNSVTSARMSAICSNEGRRTALGWRSHLSSGAATSAGTEEGTGEGRVGRVLHWSRRRVVGGPKNKPRHPGPRGSGELGEDHHSQQFYLAAKEPLVALYQRATRKVEISLPP